MPDNERLLKRIEAVLTALNAADIAQQEYSDANCANEDPIADALYEATYELCHRAKTLVTSVDWYLLMASIQPDVGAGANVTRADVAEYVDRFARNNNITESFDHNGMVDTMIQHWPALIGRHDNAQSPQSAIEAWTDYDVVMSLSTKHLQLPEREVQQ